MLLVSVLIAGSASANTVETQANITFNIRQKVLDTNHQLKIDFEFDDSETKSQFVIRPHTQLGIISILEGHDWIYGNDLWQNMPTLQDKMLVKIEGLVVEHTFIYFTLQNKKTGKTFETQKVKVWSRSFNNEYISRLNRNLIPPQIEEGDEQSNIANANSAQDYNVNEPNTPKTPTTQAPYPPQMAKKHVPAYLTAFTLSIGAGIVVKLHNGHSTKITKS
jgi:hypothetical protein